MTDNASRRSSHLFLFVDLEKCPKEIGEAPSFEVYFGGNMIEQFATSDRNVIGQHLIKIDRMYMERLKMQNNMQNSMRYNNGMMNNNGMMSNSYNPMVNQQQQYYQQMQMMQQQQPLNNPLLNPSSVENPDANYVPDIYVQFFFKHHSGALVPYTSAMPTGEKLNLPSVSLTMNSSHQPQVSVTPQVAPISSAPHYAKSSTNQSTISSIAHPSSHSKPSTSISLPDQIDGMSYEVIGDTIQDGKKAMILKMQDGSINVVTMD
jgi:hypothetical protein